MHCYFEKGCAQQSNKWTNASRGECERYLDGVQPAFLDGRWKAKKATIRQTKMKKEEEKDEEIEVKKNKKSRRARKVKRRETKKEDGVSSLQYHT